MALKEALHDQERPDGAWALPPREVPRYFRCPLSRLPLIDPVVSMTDGKTYEAQSVVDALPKSQRTVPNLALLDVMHRFICACLTSSCPKEIQAWAQKLRAKRDHKALEENAPLQPLPELLDAHAKGQKGATGAALEATVDSVLKVLKETTSYEFEVYGSAVNGFGDGHGDVDVTAIVPDHASPLQAIA